MSSPSTAGLRSNIKVTVLGECIICETRTTLRCQGCLKGGKEAEDVPFYCSREHQKQHWKMGHKTSCGQVPTTSLGWKLEKEISPCPMSKNVPEGIPYFVATQDLKAGHVLFQRKPLLSFPSLPFPVDEQQYLNKMPQIREKVLKAKGRSIWTCIGCYEVMIYGEIMQVPGRGLMINKCLYCGWPVHSHVRRKTHGLTGCEFVHQKECAIFVEKGLTWDKLREENVYSDGDFFYNLGLLRCVMLPPALKSELMKLPVLAPEFFSDGCTKKSVPFLRERCGFGDKVGDEEAKKIMLTIFGNIFLPIRNVASKNKLAFMVCQGGPTGRVMTHDCTPNCAPYVDNNLTATFKTIRNVPSGQLLTINYMVLGDLCQPVNERMKVCTELLIPLCRCKRCRSSDEDGTFFSSIKCPMDKKSGGSGKRECQYLLPMPNPTPDRVGLNDMFVWKCACSGCTGATRQKAVEQLVVTIKGKVETAAASPNAYEELKSLLAKTEGRTVHPNHAIVFYTLLNIAAVATREINNIALNKHPGFPFNLHKKYLKDFDKVMERFNQVQPGRIYNYGLFLFYQTLLKMSQLAENVTNSKTKPTFEDLEKELTSILVAMKESWTVLNDNPILEPFDLAREDRLRKFYANHLISSILKGFGKDVVEKVSSVKILQGKYYSPQPVDLEMSNEEMEYRKLLVIEDSLPVFLQKLENVVP